MREIRGCVECGSDNLEGNPGGPYAAQAEIGYGGRMLCRKCGHFGQPLSFDSEKMRKEYEKGKVKPGR